MAKNQPFFLEEWLRSVTITSSKEKEPVPASSSSAQAIIQAWTELRDSLLHHHFHARHLEALKILVSSQVSIHVADPQARLLLSVLSSQSLTLPHQAYPLFFRLLYIWLRKSRLTSQMVDSAIDIILGIFSRHRPSEKSTLFLSEGTLLLGALCFQTPASEKSKGLCLELLCELLEEEHRVIFLSDELVPSALAGAGYALSSSVSIYFGRILDPLLRIWIGGGSISHGLQLLHLIEWVLSSALNLHSLDKIDHVRELLENVKPTYSSFALVMVAAGVLRAVNRSGSSGFMHLKNCAEDSLEIVASGLVSKTKDFGQNEDQPTYNTLLQFSAVALARSGSVSYRVSFLLSLAFALSAEVFPLKDIYHKVLNLPRQNWAELPHQVKDHLGSVIFKEAGSITGIFCKQYASADEDSRNVVENLIWVYCQDVYLWHRQAKLILRGSGDELNSEIEKIAESAFLMVVVFALGVTKHRLEKMVNQEAQLETSVRILTSFSCMEYFRRMHLPEYMDIIRAIIVIIQENKSASVAFVESMPSYDELIYHHGSSDSLRMEYLWSRDDVQTARIVFYMRVIPTCVDQLPPSIFKKTVVPTMFLYLGHPNGKVARYSHSVFGAVISSANDSSEEERVLLKEQLVFYYLQRSLEGYPGTTPFEGLASGVVAIVRHLPAGSPSIFYCIHSVVEKATSLCRTLSNDDGDLWKNWEGDLEPSKKMLDLLLRLLSVTDIQVLPSLMKLLAQFIVELPSSGQNILLNQLYQQIADSDDVVRKPALVSWVQSLSYLCSLGTGKKGADKVRETASSATLDSINLPGINARL